MIRSTQPPLKTGRKWKILAVSNDKGGNKIGYTQKGCQGSEFQLMELWSQEGKKQP